MIDIGQLKYSLHIRKKRNPHLWLECEPETPHTIGLDEVEKNEGIWRTKRETFLPPGRGPDCAKRRERGTTKTALGLLRSGSCARPFLKAVQKEVTNNGYDYEWHNKWHDEQIVTSGKSSGKDESLPEWSQLSLIDSRTDGDSSDEGGRPGHVASLVSLHFCMLSLETLERFMWKHQETSYLSTLAEKLQTVDSSIELDRVHYESDLEFDDYEMRFVTNESIFSFNAEFYKGSWFQELIVRTSMRQMQIYAADLKYSSRNTMLYRMS
ncbi:hypothetical protein EV360DRAFT_76935 [Lentinula raphanica]|nr:hypothetical protein EV360DRAFT_76935 [Lentinula raphanica]